MSNEKKGIFDGFTAKDWIIGLFTGWLWIIYKMHKNGAPIGKVLGGFFGVAILMGILSSTFGEKDTSSTNNETVAKTEVKIDNSEAERIAKEKAEAERLAKEEDTLSYKNFKLGMDKRDIPSSIKLVKKDLMSSKLNTYKYIDSNNNKIKIGDYSLNVSFVISNTSNKVHHIIYTSKSIGSVSSSQLEDLVTLLTNKPLKFQNIGGVLKYSNTTKIDGIKYDTFGMYGDNNTFLKGQLELIVRASDIKKLNEEIDEMAKKVVMNEDSMNHKGYLKVSSTVGCKTEDNVNEFFTYMNLKMKNKYMELIDTYKCVVLKKGQKVFFTKDAFMEFDRSLPSSLLDKIKIIHNGDPLYFYIKMSTIKYEGKE